MSFSVSGAAAEPTALPKAHEQIDEENVPAPVNPVVESMRRSGSRRKSRPSTSEFKGGMDRARHFVRLATPEVERRLRQQKLESNCSTPADNALSPAAFQKKRKTSHSIRGGAAAPFNVSR